MASSSFHRFPDCIDMGPAERWQHARRALVVMDDGNKVAARVGEPHLLDLMREEGWLSLEERDAGLRFQADFHQAKLEAHLSASYNPVRTSMSPFGAWNERTDKQEEAYQRWRIAVKALGRFADVVTSVACYELVVTQRQKLQTKQGLKNLAVFYGIKKSSD